MTGASHANPFIASGRTLIRARVASSREMQRKWPGASVPMMLTIFPVFILSSAFSPDTERFATDALFTLVALLAWPAVFAAAHPALAVAAHVRFGAYRWALLILACVLLSACVGFAGHLDPPVAMTVRAVATAALAWAVILIAASFRAESLGAPPPVMTEADRAFLATPSLRSLLGMTAVTAAAALLLAYWLALGDSDVTEARSRLSRAGRTTVPSAVRKALGLEAGDVLTWGIGQGYAVMTRAEPGEEAPFATFTRMGERGRHGRLRQPLTLSRRRP
jgi:bifunctional DNA-binding transcriptional regulator/antitoxin component of YhaV-PrlF toxin-antitoxin module